ncbi:MAG: RagB/SusD family nutrient uptake outer membrane protein [Bacteroidales bacterium]|nr:RagB/SusD family nutrient uptake outer membrane protein [Bacteroidales bacterium]
MKKILIIFIITLSVFGCSEDFLERYPTTSKVTEGFYQTPEDAKQAVTAIYNMLLRDDWWSLFIFSDIKSDNFAGGAGTGDGGGFQRVDRAVVWPEATAHRETWTIYYGAIFRANTYLENEGLIDWTGKESLQLQYQAEARFLRAYFHYYLTQMFGEIPALDHVIVDEIPGRTPAEELYNFILQDLIFAAEHALPQIYSEVPAEDLGRITQWAAKAIIARVYMFYSGYYNDPDLMGFTASDARTYIDDIITNSGHDLVPEYASLWRVPCYSELGSDTSLADYAGEANPEVVWSIRYVGEGNASNWAGAHFQRMLGPRGTNIDPYGNGWGAMPVLPTYWNAFAPDDPRRTATILSWDDEGLTYNWESAQQAQYTGYNTKKYVIASVNGSPEARPDWQWNAFEDYMVIRFADVLLMGAELHLSSGGDAGTALTYFNRVRERAFGDSDHNYASITVDDVINERRWELGGEGLRYWDILRSCKGDFSKLVPVLTYVDENDGGDYSHTSDVLSLDVDGNRFVETRGLFQIPQVEIDLMEGAIEQNPGY